jgi:hypothetical protein
LIIHGGSVRWGGTAFSRAVNGIFLQTARLEAVPSRFAATSNSLTSR